jgi:uncharacterized protein (TIGR02217 family)
MSNSVFPVLPGLEWNFKRVPMHKTTIKETVSGREYRSKRMTSPRYKYKGSYEFLRDSAGFDELRPLLGFFNARGGSFDDWLFDDLDDNTVTAQTFGVGDGVTPTFQLVRTLGGNVEPVYAVNSVPLIYKSAVLQTVGTHYTINSTGGVTFVAAPAAAAPLTWTGTFYWRCRFVEDQLEFNKFMNKLWSLKTCDFITVKP